MTTFQVLMYSVTKEDKYRRQAAAILSDWLPGGHVTYTPRGLAYRAAWGSLRYTGEWVSLCLVSVIY